MALRPNSFLSNTTSATSRPSLSFSGGGNGHSSSNNNKSNNVSIAPRQHQPHQSQAPLRQPTAASQFQAWAHERDVFRQAAEQANQERVKLETEVQQLRQQQRSIGQEIHVTSDRLGRVHRERELLGHEQARLQGTLEKERAELEKCSKETENFVQTDFAKKKDFCRAMQALNTELADLLMKKEDFRLQQLLSTDTAPLLLEHYQKASPDSKDESKEGEIEVAITILKEETIKYDETLTKHKRLHDSLTTLREQAVKVPLSGDSGSSNSQVR